MDQSNDSLALSIEQKTKKGCERKMLTDKIVKSIFFFLWVFLVISSLRVLLMVSVIMKGSVWLKI